MVWQHQTNDCENNNLFILIRYRRCNTLSAVVQFAGGFTPQNCLAWFLSPLINLIFWAFHLQLPPSFQSAQTVRLLWCWSSEKAKPGRGSCQVKAQIAEKLPPGALPKEIQVPLTAPLPTWVFCLQEDFWAPFLPAGEALPGKTPQVCCGMGTAGRRGAMESSECVLKQIPAPDFPREGWAEGDVQGARETLLSKGEREQTGSALGRQWPRFTVVWGKQGPKLKVVWTNSVQNLQWSGASRGQINLKWSGTVSRII